MAAGQYGHHCGVTRYGQDLKPGYPTFARQLSRHGYQTTACGKLHHVGPDQMQGWMKRVGMDQSVQPSFIDKRDESAWDKRPDPAFQSPDHKDGGLKWGDVKEIKRAGIGRGSDTHDMDDYAELGAHTVIRKHFIDPTYDRPNLINPLMLYVGFNNPHYPYLADEERFCHYLNRVPVYDDEDPFDHPWLGKSPFEAGPVTVGPQGMVNAREIRRATAAYYANIERVDGQFASIAQSLRNAGEDLDEWIIIYCSDHGEMLGEHSIWEKQKFFEGSARVPLIIRYPKSFKGGTRVHENVNLIDLYATLCELTDCPVPSGLDSRSLVPLACGNGSDWDNATFSQFDGWTHMLKRDHYKFQSFSDKHPEVLFDLKADPKETTNFIDHPDYQDVASRLREELRVWLSV